MGQVGFAERAFVGDRFEDCVDELLTSLGHRVAMFGVERLGSDFHQGLVYSSDPRAVTIRNMPDRLGVIGGTVVGWDAKATRTVERFAFESYLEWDKLLPIYLFAIDADRWTGHEDIYYGRVSESLLHPGQWTVDNRKGGKPWDVVEGWVVPPQGGRGSGKPFRNINFDRMAKMEIK